MVKTSISTTYRAVDGWHVFVSDDLPGLYVASKDLYSAYHDVAGSIQALLKLDEGVDCSVAPEVPLQDFLAMVRGGEMDNGNIVPEARRFCVSGAHA
jgi:hypothetical protein